MRTPLIARSSFLVAIIVLASCNNSGKKEVKADPAARQQVMAMLSNLKTSYTRLTDMAKNMIHQETADESLKQKRLAFLEENLAITLPEDSLSQERLDAYLQSRYRIDTMSRNVAVNASKENAEYFGQTIEALENAVNIARSNYNAAASAFNKSTGQQMPVISPDVEAGKPVEVKFN